MVLDQFDGEPEKQYRDKLRGMISNLKDKKNPGLRKGVVSGDITVQKFCVMTKEVNNILYKSLFYIYICLFI